MQQVAYWLEKVGLGQYAQRFAENDISFSILSDLTDQDLEKIGVASLGHRRLLLREIALLGKTADAAPTAPSKSAPPIATPTLTAEAAGERRHVTVMFCDLVDSTGISAKLDAEEWRDLVGAYLAARLCYCAAEETRAIFRRRRRVGRQAQGASTFARSRPFASHSLATVLVVKRWHTSAKPARSMVFDRENERFSANP
jgi:class 3 adenylate cyclase